MYQRDNLIIELRTKKPGRALLLESHMDTVSLGNMRDPLIPIYQGGKLYGRGACDTKATLAGMIYAMEQCAQSPVKVSNNVIFCASVDEEHAFRGLSAFMDLNLPISGAIVGEPTEMGIVVEHKGCARFTIRTHGKAAHSSVPQEGDNAIYQMMEVIRYIQEQIEPELLKSSSLLCGQPTIVVGTIKGGQQINIVPDSCEIDVDRRIIPGENPENVLKHFQEELTLALEHKGINFTIESLLLDPALNTPHDALIVQEAMHVARILGLNDSLRGVPFGSDASKLQQWKGIPSIVYGPGSIAQAHSIEEWVPVEDVGRAAEFYLRMAQSFTRF
ncbi:Acetylornithine deacetylase [compost metagenome]